MLAQTEAQTITINKLPDILKNKGNMTIKFGQAIDFNLTLVIFFFKNHAENETKGLVLHLFLFFKKLSLTWECIFTTLMHVLNDIEATTCRIFFKPTK